MEASFYNFHIWLCIACENELIKQIIKESICLLMYELFQLYGCWQVSHMIKIADFLDKQYKAKCGNYKKKLPLLFKGNMSGA
jgi:hypothetical protein